MNLLPNLLPLAAVLFVSAVVCVIITLNKPTPYVIDREKVEWVKIDAEGKYVVIHLRKEGAPYGEALLIQLDGGGMQRFDSPPPPPPATPDPTPLFINKEAVR